MSLENTFNCPNCGAPINSDICPYCNTTFIDWSCIDDSKPNWVKIKLNGRIILVKVYLIGLDAHYEPPEPVSLFSDDHYHNLRERLGELEIETRLIAVPFRAYGQNGNVLSVTVDVEKADLQEAGRMLHNTIYEI